VNLEKERALLFGAGHGDSMPPAELEDSFVAQNVQGPLAPCSC